MTAATPPLTPPPVCPACGYDLRGAPSARCPECGTDAAAASAVPWEHRRRQGTWTAFRRTVRMAAVRPGQLGDGAAAARSFAAWAVVLFVVAGEAVVAAATWAVGGPGYADRVPIDLVDQHFAAFDQPFAPPDWMLLWPAGATRLWVPPVAMAAGAWAWVALVARLGGSGARYAAAASLALLAAAVPAAAGGAALARVGTGWSAVVLPGWALEAAAVPLAVASVWVGWWGTARAAGQGRGIVTAAGVPVATAVAIVVGGFAVPCGLGLAWFMIDSLRG